LKKTMLIVAMAIAMAVAAPIAMAQVERDSEQDVESGEVDQSFSVTGSGNSSQCAEIQSAAQTGNTQDLVGVIDAAREEGGDVSFEEGGSSVTMSPELATECVQEINQAASAAGGAEKKVTPPPAPVPTPAPAPKAAPAPAYASEVSPASAVKAGESSPASAVKAGESKTLPQSGGDLTSIFALGVGALLVTGGIVARRLIR
jgi:hypothetical protein